MLKRLTWTIGAAATMLLVLASTAAAADFYVDKDTGNDANLATNCQQANPCASLAVGTGLASGAGTGNTLRVDDSVTAYSAPNISLCGDVSILGDDFVGGVESSDGKPIVSVAAAGTAAFFVSGGCTVNEISGLHFQTGDGNGVTATAGPIGAITNNVFEDPGASGGDVGVISGTGTTAISGNTFTGLLRGVQVNGGAAVIAGNDFSGMRANAVVAGAGSLQLSGNFIHDPGIGGEGFRLGASGPTVTLSATTSRNRIFGGSSGILVLDTAGPISLNGDLVAGQTTSAITTSDTDLNGDTDISGTNLTAVAAGSATRDIELDGQLTLTLDSTIVGDHGINALNGATCSIVFSRGPTTTPGTSGCGGFQTTADPAFASTNATNPLAFRLLAGSPMIDSGNPAPPVAGALDIDAQPRLLDGDGVCPMVRDIGADEFAGVTLDCTPPASVTQPPPAGSTPPPVASAPTKKKCKKAKKGASAAKKKCKKRK